jgi:hypothetical protein
MVGPGASASQVPKLCEKVPDESRRPASALSLEKLPKNVYGFRSELIMCIVIASPRWANGIDYTYDIYGPMVD